MINNTNITMNTQDNVNASSAFILEDIQLIKCTERRTSADTISVDSENNEPECEKQCPRSPDSSPSKPGSAFGLYCQNFANNFEGDFIRKFDQKEIYVFMCHMGHKFMLTKKQILAGVWCTNCTKVFNNIQRFVAQNKGQLLSTSVSRTIRIKCENGHIWETGYKKACLRWCRECCRTNKQLLKDMIQKENKKIEEEKRQQQVT